MKSSRIRTAILVCSLLLVPLFAQTRAAHAAAELTYPQALDLAVAAMEEGKHIQALGPMRAALNIDRNDPCGVLALGTLYLHAGSLDRARREFERAHTLAPDELLALWGEALTDLAQGKRNPAAFTSLPADAIPAAPIMAQYVRLLNGEGVTVRAETRDVAATEPDPLRLEVAAFAALRGADSARGESLLSALVNRPDMKALSEDRAYLLLFLPDKPAQGGAPTLPAAIVFPEPGTGYPLTGTVTVAPPPTLPPGTAMLTYSTEGGGGWTATTNNPPYTTDWNTARFPNGLYTLRTVAYDNDHHVLLDTRRTVVLSNPNAPPSHVLSDDERKEMRQRLLTLLTPRASRKAAWYALGEQARLRGNDENALAATEAVVAIDPLFQDARETLRDFRRGEELSGAISWWRGATSEKIVALTFDDGPNPLPTRTPALLDVLKKVNAPSTFFVVGARAEQCTDLLKRMTEEGHEIADHSYSHPNLTYLDPPAIERELCRTAVIIRQATGKRPHFYRPPGGNFNSAVISAAESLGMAGAYWTIDGVNFENGPFPPEKLTQFVLGKVRPGAIILLHNAPENTIKALPQIVKGLRDRGYEMVTMSELARRCRPAGSGSVAAKTGPKVAQRRTR